jgi:hypothetical protein
MAALKIRRNERNPDRFYVLHRFVGGFNALRTRQQVFFDQGEFGFVLHHPKVEAFEILFGNVFHALIVGDAAEGSQVFCSASKLLCCPVFSM